MRDISVPAALEARLGQGGVQGESGLTRAGTREGLWAGRSLEEGV